LTLGREKPRVEVEEKLDEMISRLLTMLVKSNLIYGKARLIS